MRQEVDVCQQVRSVSSRSIVFHEPVPGALRFFKLPPPSDDDVVKHLCRIGHRVEDLVTYWDATPRDGDAALDATLAESLERRCRFSGIDIPIPQTPRCARIDGYSLHADVGAEADQRSLLERLLRYGARPSFAESRLSLTRDGKVGLATVEWTPRIER